MRQHAEIERYIEFMAAAIQVPSFLIVRKAVDAGDCILADPLYDNLLRDWLAADAYPAPPRQMDEFVFSLASSLRAYIQCDEQLALNMATRGYRTRNWVSAMHIQTMTNWMLATPISQIAHLAACWLQLIDATDVMSGTAPLSGLEDADPRTALAWQVIQNNVDGLSFRSAHNRALASQTTGAVVDGWCGLRRL